MSNCSKCHGGPGYASPAEAISKGLREKTMFVTAPHAKLGNDAIFAIDVDPESETYCEVVGRVDCLHVGDEVHHIGWNACSSCHEKPSEKRSHLIIPCLDSSRIYILNVEDEKNMFLEKVISRVDCLHIGDEVHHTGWNACSSCHDNPTEKRSHLIVPCLNSDRIYIVNVENERNIFLEKAIEPSSLHLLNLSFPHTSHCLADGNIMISTLGTADGKPSGNFLLLDGKTFETKGTWIADDKTVPFNYDFWYQPRRNVMISTEWGSPNHIKQGFNMEDVGNNVYGNSLHIFDWGSHKLKQTIDLPIPNGTLPFEIRFLHNPDSNSTFVGTALGSSIYHIHQDPKDPTNRVADEVIVIPCKNVKDWMLPEMPAFLTDILISMDDKYLYFSCWLHGDIRQYDITDPYHPKLTGQIYIGGSCHTESGITVDEEEETIPALYVKGRKIEGGPQMLQLSLDGTRLYVTTSLYKKWDQQFYPTHVDTGSVMLQIDVSKTGKMTLNPNFLVDFGKIPGGPYLAHEMRYPGGDCTSDIWI